ncbi:MAG: hypothetical protein ACE5HC_16525 [Candidatus Binatia bacterium]
MSRHSGAFHACSGASVTLLYAGAEAHGGGVLRYEEDLTEGNKHHANEDIGKN